MADFSSIFAPLQQQGGGGVPFPTFERTEATANQFKRKIVMQEALERDLAPEDGDAFYKYTQRRLFELGDLEGAFAVEGQRQALSTQQEESLIERLKLQNTIRGTDIRERTEDRQQAEADLEAGITGGFEMSPEGNEVFVERDANKNIVSVKNLGGASVEVNLPGPGVAGTEFTKSELGKIQGKIVQAKASLGRMVNIQQTFDPGFLTVQGKLEASMLDIKDRFGKAKGDEKRRLSEISRFRQNTKQNLNRLVNELSGAATSEQEAARISGEIPTDKDGPTRFKAKMDNSIRLAKLAVARYSFMLGQGIPKEQIIEMVTSGRAVDLDGMEDIMNQEIARLKAQNPGASAAEITQLAKDLFGL